MVREAIKSYTAEDAERLSAELGQKSAEEIVRWAGETFGPAIKFANSFGAEDVALQDIIAKNAPAIEWDEGNSMIKVNPLIEWSNDDVWAYIKANKVPYNRLHDQGYPSIGCAPCTRAIKPGEDIRAGRWWWENPEYKECGLHH